MKFMLVTTIGGSSITHALEVDDAHIALFTGNDAERMIAVAFRLMRGLDEAVRKDAGEIQ